MGIVGGILQRLVGAPTARRASERVAVVEALEPRILYSADLAPVVADAAVGPAPEVRMLAETVAAPQQAALATAQKAAGATATLPAPQTYKGSSYQRSPTDPTTVFGTVGNFLVEGSESGGSVSVLSMT